MNPRARAYWAPAVAMANNDSEAVLNTGRSAAISNSAELVPNDNTEAVTNNNTDVVTNKSTDDTTRHSATTLKNTRTEDGTNSVGQPPRKRRKIFDFPSTALCRVIVGKDGDEQEEFVVNADLVIRRSTFFKNKLSSRWNKTADNTVKLPEAHTDTFRAYSHYIHTGEIPVVTEDGDPWNVYMEESSTASALYVLADELIDRKTKSELLYFFWWTFSPKDKRIPDPEFFRTIYEGTAEGDALRKLSKQMWAAMVKEGKKKPTRFPTKWLGARGEYVTRSPKEFVVDVLEYNETTPGMPEPSATHQSRLLRPISEAVMHNGLLRSSEYLDQRLCTFHPPTAALPSIKSRTASDTITVD
ncbi:hypothetical protein M011DRAFT_523039 [Sporormia fimetaria CBS 119925]|uniref:BTB domain-containing protein n=1 Tax=Sporormia fimetaria CBS 119925 TaxID=1340428 RepID=A0A6A6VSI5_9PLEO|nr:hypothetical protein M011DRAFT_523039 [Sporormia fimetaria CBS 119925]